jgi:hypothetical protein
MAGREVYVYWSRAFSSSFAPGRTAVLNGVTRTWLVNLFAHLEHHLFKGAQATLARAASSRSSNSVRALSKRGNRPSAIGGHGEMQLRPCCRCGFRRAAFLAVAGE